MKKCLAVIVCLFFCVAAAYAQPPAKNTLLMGAAWYPEQWPESQWDADLTLMEQAHIHVVRVGEFAWSTLEPQEGRFDLDWLDRAITLATKHHIAVVIGTPVDAPPAWLTKKYPETLGMNADGHLREHGTRRQFNYANPKYRELCALIVEKLAQRFGANPDVVGWQIGNEYSNESYDPATRAQFQQFLRDKYKTLDALNSHWTTAYWSQTYDSWDEIPMESSGGNPGLMLEHKRFVTATWRSFQKDEIDVLRRYIQPSQFITTNTGGQGWSDSWDHYAVNKDLDIASWDDYVGEGPLDPAKNAMLNDLARGWKNKDFWIMETQPGSVNWTPINTTLARGVVRAMAWQGIGHGSDAVLYWQWRDALNGQEQYHGSLVGPDGKPMPLYPELQQLGKEFEETSSAIAGTTPHSDVAILHDYDSRWAIDFQQHTRLYDQQQVMLRFYTPLEHYAQSVDIVQPADDLSQYKLVVAPDLNIISADLAKRLTDYVKAGGHLLLGPRSGMKDEYNALNPQRQPGPLAETLGGHVDAFYALEGTEPLGTHGTTDIWAETLIPTAPDTHVDLRYGKTTDGWLDNQPAMIDRNAGKGNIAYLGALPDAITMKNLITSAAVSAGVQPIWKDLPEGVELCRRIGPSGTVYILINHWRGAAQIDLPGPMTDLLASTPAAVTSLQLPPQGVAVLVPQHK